MKRQIVCVECVLRAWRSERVAMAGQVPPPFRRITSDTSRDEGPPLDVEGGARRKHWPRISTSSRCGPRFGSHGATRAGASLVPPMLEGTIWQWPVNSINPANTNMYMFMLGQELPGRGKRELRAAVAEKDIALAETDVTIRDPPGGQRRSSRRTRSLFIARKATEVHLASVDLLRQIADVSQAEIRRPAASRSRTC